jgi:hypothetical protein
MDSISRPVKSFAITVWGIEYLLELLDTFSGAAQTENALDIGGYIRDQQAFRSHSCIMILTSFLQKDSAFGNDYRNVSIHVVLPLLIRERYGDVCVFDADIEGYAENADRCLHYVESPCQRTGCKISHVTRRATTPC